MAALVHKIEEEVTGEFFLCNYRACLPTTMATAPYHTWTVNVSYTDDFFEP